MSDNSENNTEEFTSSRVEMTETLKKRNNALGLTLLAVVILIGVVSYYKIQIAA